MQYAGVDTQLFHHCIWFLFLYYINWTWCLFLFGCMFQLSVGLINPTEHYWKRVLCRGPEALPRAKSRALGKDTLCRGPDTRALGKERPSANQIFAEGRGPQQRCPRQIRPVGSRRPFSVKLCRGPPVRPLAKVFFPVQPGYSAIFLSLCRGP